MPKRLTQPDEFSEDADTEWGPLCASPPHSEGFPDDADTECVVFSVRELTADADFPEDAETESVSWSIRELPPTKSPERVVLSDRP
jgi:hypothetical protein